MKLLAQLLSISLLFFGWLATVGAVPQLSAPTNASELQQRAAEIREQYQPYLRSLPTKLESRQRTLLNGKWQFRYELQDATMGTALPATPHWYQANLDLAKWEPATVPQWRYRRGEEGSILGGKDQFGWGARKEHSNIAWYRTEFAATKPAEGQRLWLCFDAVDWEAEVYLNGERLGNHRVSYEPFRFDVTDKVRSQNYLAVRVIDGRVFGEPHAFWAPLPEPRAESQVIVRDRSQSLQGVLPISYHGGTGFGILGDVYLEETGSAVVSAVFVRNNLTSGMATVKIELDRFELDIKQLAPSAQYQLEVQLLPENFTGKSYKKTMDVEISAGETDLSLQIPMPDAKAWSPETPHLYRCRVQIRSNSRVIDAQDALFGCRSFQVVSKKDEQIGMAEGTLLLNGEPCFLRGTNVAALNAYSYWQQDEKLLDALLMLKAANFNSVRVCQHVHFPEVRELLDRLGIMSEQDQGAGYLHQKDGLEPPIMQQLVHTGTVLARETYNNPGVVLLTFANECLFDPTEVVRAALAVDPDRIIKPISGRLTYGGEGKPMVSDDSLLPNLVDDMHRYEGWYKSPDPKTWKLAAPRKPGPLVIVGEYGAEALDSYETMSNDYPSHLSPPPPTTDTLWGASQVKKNDPRQILGLGRVPKNLGEYIEASQNWQEQSLAAQTIGFRISPRRVSGYFQFHFLDPTPAFWPKSVVSFNLAPKKAYYQLAQINQPVVPLPQFVGQQPDEMVVWVANDLPQPFSNCRVEYQISQAGKTLIEGTEKLNVPASGAVQGRRVNVSSALSVNQGSSGNQGFDVVLTLKDEEGSLISSYRGRVRQVPK